MYQTEKKKKELIKKLGGDLRYYNIYKEYQQQDKEEERKLSWNLSRFAVYRGALA